MRSKIYMFLTGRVCFTRHHNDNKNSAILKEWSSHRESNSGPLPYQGSTLPLSHASLLMTSDPVMWLKNGAGEEIRTLDIHLGRVALYQLSYARKQNLTTKMVAWGGFEPPKADAGRFTVCSLWPLGNHAIFNGAAHRNRTCDLRFTKPLLYQLS